MTKRIQWIRVVLDQEYKGKDIEDIIEALRGVKGVGTVERIGISKVETLQYDAEKLSEILSDMGDSSNPINSAKGKHHD